MKKRFLTILFTAAILCSFSSIAFADGQQSPAAQKGVAPVTIVPLNHGVDY